MISLYKHSLCFCHPVQAFFPRLRLLRWARQSAAPAFCSGCSRFILTSCKLPFFGQKVNHAGSTELAVHARCVATCAFRTHVVAVLLAIKGAFSFRMTIARFAHCSSRCFRNVAVKREATRLQQDPKVRCPAHDGGNATVWPRGVLGFRDDSFPSDFQFMNGYENVCDFLDSFHTFIGLNRVKQNSRSYYPSTRGKILSVAAQSCN